MKKLTLDMPQLALIAGTRALLGAGAGILLTEGMDRKERRLLGWTLGLVGLLTTIPLVMEIVGRKRSEE